MGHTNSTANLGLPQFIGTDKPTWLGDINSAFAAVDAYAGTNDAAVAGAVADAGSAIAQASAAVNTANTANATAGNASTAANNAVGVANTANAIAGTVDAKVGLLADLHTSDRTSIVNAINELVDGSTVSVTGDGVKTTAQVLNELFALIDPSRLTPNSVLESVTPSGTSYFRLSRLEPGVYRFTQTLSDYTTGTSLIDTAQITAATSTFGECIITAGSTSYNDASSTVVSATKSYAVRY